MRSRSNELCLGREDGGSSRLRLARELVSTLEQGVRAIAKVYEELNGELP